MTNQQIKRSIEKLTGEKVYSYIRHDGNNWYEGEASSGNTSTYTWSEHYTRREAMAHVLTKLLEKVNAR